MNVHIVDGTYELFRHFYAMPSATDVDGNEVAAVRGVLGSMLSLLEAGATHVGVATDHVVESFRNDLWPGYKTGEGVDPELLSQFEPLEEALEALGLAVWGMVEYEADDAMAAAAAMAAADERVERVFLCTPDKDLGQCVVGGRVVQLDRRRDEVRDEAAVIERFGVPPASVPDWLALVGDSADGFPGIRGWGAKSAATVLARYGHIADIPDDAAEWDVEVRGAERLARKLADDRERAMLFLELATVRIDALDLSSVDDLEWTGPAESFAPTCERLRAADLLERAESLAGDRSGV